MTHSHPIRSPTEKPSGVENKDGIGRQEQADRVEPAAPRATARVTFGDELRRERELRQVELRDIAEATKINRRYLEALERNDFTVLPGGLFNRSFVRAYCQTIGIDDEAMVNAYLLEEQTQAAKSDRFDPDVWRGDPRSRTAAGPPARSSVGRRSGSAIWWWVLAAAILLLSVAAVLYLRYWPLDDLSLLPGRVVHAGLMPAVELVVLEKRR